MLLLKPSEAKEAEAKEEESRGIDGNRQTKREGKRLHGNGDGDGSSGSLSTSPVSPFPLLY